MIPKIIHYCWFGGKPLPRLALKCIESWRKYFPDYQIIQWDESNFDVNSIKYTEQAYSAGKFAFVSDYARFKILHDEGGIYFDTDVEVIKSFDDIIERGGFMGCEISTPSLEVAPGLGLGIEPNNPLYKTILDFYSSLEFYKSDGSLNLKTVVKYITEILIQNGLDLNETGIQKIKSISIYPQEYFNPLDDATGKLNITENTHSIHWYAKSWVDTNKARVVISRLSHRLFGVSFSAKMRKMLNIK